MFALRTILGFFIVALDELRGGYSDEQLVAMIVGESTHSSQAYQVLVERHQNWMVGMLANLIGDRQEAEDLAQNVFTRVFFALSKFRGDSSLKTWLRTIATREAYSHHRKRSDKPIDPGDFDHFDGEDGEQRRVDERDALARALAKVPYPYREILVLRYIEELDLDEIGVQLELGKSATKMRLKRARDYFKDAYGAI